MTIKSVAKTILIAVVVILATCSLRMIQAVTDLGFQVMPGSQAIVYGQDLFLNCVAVNLTTGSSEGLAVSWHLNKKPRGRKTSIYSNGTLLVPAVTEDDLGNYMCIVFDESERVVLQSPPADVFHAYIKMFEVSPTQILAIEDEIVSLDCITGESAPPAHIYWEKDGQPFLGGDQYNATYGGYQDGSLVKQFSMKLIQKAKPYLDGTYNCVARNPVLQIDVRSLKVLMRTAELESMPYVMDAHVQSEVIKPVAQPMVLDCPITGKPEVSITWYKAGLKIEGQSDFFILQNGSLHSPGAKLEHDGEFYCIGTNILGVATSPVIAVTVARLDIDFIQTPEDLFVIAGLPAVLKCTPPISVPKATITWYKDNALLVPRTGKQSVLVVETGDTDWNVQFAEVQKHDEGEYFCVAINNHAVPPSRTSTMAVVSVGGAPIFIEPPTGLTIEKGKLAQMICYVQGDPFPDVVWLFEDTTLEVSDAISFRQGNQELWIGNIHKGNEGTYTCRASNRYGTIQTRVYIKVLVAPVIMVPVGDTIVSLGDPVIIPCGVYSDPAPAITWYKDSVPINMNGRFTQIQDGLYITSVIVEDTGKYTCQAVNMAGSVSSEGSLQIQVLPHFVDAPENQIVTIGKNTTLTCVANGYPKPEITWLFNGSNLFPQDTLLSLNKQTLLLMSVDWMHVGTYTCHAFNIEGSVSTSATVKLQIPPKVERIEGIPLLYQGESLTLKCHVNGIPTPQIEWWLNREPIVESQNGRVTLPDSRSLQVQFVTAEDTGIYTCKSSNAAGVSQKYIQVHVLSFPSAPVLYRAETQTAESILLSWSTEQTIPQTPVNSVVIYYRKKLQPTSQMIAEEVSATQLQYEVTSLDPASEYIFMVAAVNGAGTSQVSNILAARTYDAGPSEPRNLYAESVNGNNITLGFEIPATTNGVIRKYKIQYTERNGLEERNIIISGSSNASMTYIIEDLQPYTWYTLEVQGATMEGDQVLWGNWSNTLNVRTLEAAPTGRPLEVKAQPITHDLIQISWEAVSQEKQNGPIKRYFVRYWLLSNKTTPLGEKVSESLDLKVNISDLDPWTWYMFKVIPENDGGQGSPSEDIFARTLPTAPTGAPTNTSAEILSHNSIRMSWEAPALSEWNSDLTGYVVQYWTLAATMVTTLTVFGVDDTSLTVSTLTPWTTYEFRIAAFTNQLANGIGPYSGNVTMTTLQSEPEIVKDLIFTATATSIWLSWKPPLVTNGIVISYQIKYSLIGSVLDDTPTLSSISDFVGEIYNDTEKMSAIFLDLRVDLDIADFTKIVEMCDLIFINTTLVDNLNKTADSESHQALQSFDVSPNFIGWILTNGINVINLCKKLETAALQIADEYTEKTAYPVYNMTSTETQLVINDLEPGHIYNLSVAAATVAGNGLSSFITSTTLKDATTKQTTPQPPIPITKQPSIVTPLLQQGADNSDEPNLPVIIGGGVSGLVLILLILLLVICLFVRRRRAQSEEKTQVIRHGSIDEGSSNNIFGELDRPRLPTMAAAAEDGTDSVDMYGDHVRFHSPQHTQHGGTVNSFMTIESGQMPPETRNGRRVKEAFLGMENPSYDGRDEPTSVKNNPAYFDEPSSSELESMSVTMAFSSEDMYSQQGDSTLRRKNKMKNIDAAAIARLRNNAMPPGMAVDNDTSGLINNEVEVIYNERTAL